MRRLMLVLLAVVVGCSTRHSPRVAPTSTTPTYLNSEAIQFELRAHNLWCPAAEMQNGAGGYLTASSLCAVDGNELQIDFYSTRTGRDVVLRLLGQSAAGTLTSSIRAA
jgi:hypothetical protein